MRTKRYIEIPRIRIPIWLPNLRGNWRAWLPSRGNVLFTSLVIGALFWAQSVGAFPLPAPAAPTAASTGTIAYQGRLADAGGAPLTGAYSMIFRLYNIATGSTPLWSEQWTGPNSVQVSDGLFNVMLGSMTAIPPNVVTGNSNLWLGITVGSDDEMLPRVQLGSVPFAVQALTVPDGSVTRAKLASDIESVLTETSGSYISTITVSEGVSPTVSPSTIQLTYKRTGSMVFVSMPLFWPTISGNPQVMNVSLPFPPDKNDEGASGNLWYPGGTTTGVAVNGLIHFRHYGSGYTSGPFRGGFWYIAAP
jgi:hypothetical protein